MTRRQTYRSGPAFNAGFALDMLLGRKRSYSRDGERLLGGLAIAPTVEGEALIPAAGPLVVAANHYQRPGLWVGFGAMLISAAVARRRRGQDVLWVMAGEWRGRIVGPVPWPAPALRWLFGRIAATYGHILMPMNEGEASARAAAVREMLRTLRAGGTLGLLPEAGNSPGGLLRRPAPEIGRLLVQLARHDAPVLPAALHESASGALVATFGRPLDVRGHDGAAALDTVMGAIAALLPAEMRGPYAG